MRLRRLLALTATSLLLAAACGDDDTELDSGSPGEGTSAPAAGTSADVPDEPPALVGVITEVTPFEPVSEDDDVVGSVLVEEQPGVAEGRKISYTVTTETVIAGETGDGSSVEGFDDLAPGQQVQSWVAGDVCAESYPEQCGAAALLVVAGP